MPYITEIMVFCLVLGDDLSSRFEVNINMERTVSGLQKIIKQAKENAFTTIDADKLKLWKVEIPTRVTNKKLEILENKRHDQIDVESDLDGILLQPDDVVEELFNEQPPPKHIHIIIQPPNDKWKLPMKIKTEKEVVEDILLATLTGDLTLQSPDVKKLSHKFYDRDQALNLILDVARTNYSGRESSDHKDHEFILIPGGIGIGKTRMGWESQHMFSRLKPKDSDADDFIEALKNPCYIFVDLNNGCKYIKEFDEIVGSSVRIGTRLAVASVEAIIIHLDEYQFYINDVQKYQQKSWADARDYFKSLLREIGSVMRGNMMVRTENKYAGDSYHGLDGKYFIIPICTGTSAIDIHFLPTEHTNRILELNPLNYDSAKSMFLDKYEYSRQTTEAGRNLVVQGLKLYYMSDLSNEDNASLSTKFCNLILNQQHFRIAIYDTGFIPKFIDDLLGPSVLTSDFDWGNQLFNKISNRNIAKVGDNPGNWESLDDIRTVISFGLTRQLVKRDFLLPSLTSIGELERAGLVYLSNSEDEWYTIVMPFMILKVLNIKLLVSQVETVFPDQLLLIPTHDSLWQWQDFELLYVYYQKAIIDSLIEVQKSMISSTQHKIQLLYSHLQQEVEAKKRTQIDQKIKIQNEKLTDQMNMNWRLSDVFRGAKGDDTLLQRRVRLYKLKVFTEKENFLQRTDSIAILNKSILCDDNVTRSFDEGIFRCHRGCANIDHRWVLDSSNSEKKLAIFLQIKYSECDASTTISTSFIKKWYETTMSSVKNYEAEYDVVLVLFTNRRCSGQPNFGKMPHLLLICLENIESYLSPTFAHRGLVDRPSE
ncbi:11796_t:CDS:2, partial [Racocetra fulgida]